MTVVKLSKNGFNLKGHSTADAEDEIGKLVCASISSAAYLTVNTITDVIGDKAEIDLGDEPRTFLKASSFMCFS